MAVVLWVLAAIVVIVGMVPNAEGPVVLGGVPIIGLLARPGGKRRFL